MSSRSGWCALLLLVTSAASAETHPEPEISVTRLQVQVPPVTDLTPLLDRAQNALPDSGEAPQKSAKARRMPRKKRIEPPGLLSKRPRR